MSELEILEYAYKNAKWEWNKAYDYALQHWTDTNAANAVKKAWEKMIELEQLIKKKRAGKPSRK